MRTYIEYLPGFLRLIKDYQGIGDAVDPEVNNLVELQQQLEKNAVILDADSAIIRRWEHILDHPRDRRRPDAAPLPRGHALK